MFGMWLELRITWRKYTNNSTRFYLREDAEAAVRFINGTRLDDRIIRWGRTWMPCGGLFIQLEIFCIPVRKFHGNGKSQDRLGRWLCGRQAVWTRQDRGAGLTIIKNQQSKCHLLQWLLLFRWGMSTGLISTLAEGDMARSSSRSWRPQMASCET